MRLPICEDGREGVIKAQENYGNIRSERNGHQNEGRRAIGNNHHAAHDREQEADSK